MRFSFHSRNYPGAPDLTARSERIGFLTSTLMSLCYAVIPAIIGILSGSDDLFGTSLVISVCALIALPIGLAILRKSLFGKLDREYAAREQPEPAVQPQPEPAVRPEPAPQVSKPEPAPRRTVKMYFQRTPAECGAACLCMILDYYGRPMPLAQVCADSGVTEAGCSAGGIMRAAKHYGLPCYGFKTDADKLRSFRSPVMLHWCGNHFVVLEEIRDDLVYINDPAVGKITTDFETLRQHYSNVVLVFEEIG